MNEELTALEEPLSSLAGQERVALHDFLEDRDALHHLVGGRNFDGASRADLLQATMRIVARPKTVERTARVELRGDSALRLAVVADTHSAPHPAATQHLRALAPDAILHAGDIGNLAVLEELGAIAPVFAIRGNIDVRAPSLPDVLTLDVVSRESVLLRILMMHIAVDGPRLRADAARLARSRDASLVVCGHSHVPLIARDGGLSIFNPGSVGPRRFQLPVLFGTIDVTLTGVHLAHFSDETGCRWAPKNMTG